MMGRVIGMRRDTRIPDLISVTEAAEILNISRQAIHKRIDANQLPAAQVGQQVVLRRTLVESIAIEEGALLTWGDLAVRVGLPRDTGAEKTARFAGALTAHDPRTGRTPKPWTGKGIDYRLTRAQADELAAEWGRMADDAERLSYLSDGRDPEVEEIADRYRP